jgi:hypothetical protein
MMNHIEAVVGLVLGVIGLITSVGRWAGLVSGSGGSRR